MTKIFINPGHSKNGQPDAGCAYNGIKEYDIANKIAEQLAVCLKYNGFQVEVYQQCGCNNDSNKQLNTVAQKANASMADAFISIHMNGFKDATTKGTETWYLKNSSKGKLLAGYINSELVKPCDGYVLTNRGAKYDQRGLAVLKYTNMPAILTEIGFISNTNEAKFIATHVEAIAQRLCNAICRYFNKAPKEWQPPTPIQESKYPQEVILTHVGDGKYDVNVDEELKLKGNKLATCLDWIKKTYE